MNDIVLKNFRNIVDSGEIELKPITILVGANGSGKSSFLRLFPLLQQSCFAAKQGPILWYSENGVDFGDFNSTVRKGEKEMSIGFSMEYGTQRFKVNICVDIVPQLLNNKQDGDIIFDYIKNVRLSFLDNDVLISKKDDYYYSVIVNGETSDDFNFESDFSIAILPLIDRHKSTEISGFDVLIELLKENGKYKYRSSEDFIGLSFDDFKKLLNDKEYPYNIRHVYNNIVIDYISTLLTNIQLALRLELDNLIYIGPFRESPKRYYRFQNLATDKIDMSGKNMAVFVKAMLTENKKKFDKLLKRNYEFEIEAESHFGQVSLYIKKDGNKTNIVDNGFGYSQLMPVLLALHSFQNTQKKSFFPFSNDWSILCIEQPELHLHPSMQYKVGKTFASVVSNIVNNEENKKIIVETHSRSFIEAIGESISSGNLGRDDVAVYIFSSVDNKSSIKKATFDEDGYLNNWPLGFLD